MTSHAGVVSFTGCDIRVMIVVKSSSDNACVGLIPNDQESFCSQLSTVIVEAQRQTHQLTMRVGQQQQRGQAPNVTMGTPGGLGHQLRTMLLQQQRQAQFRASVIQQQGGIGEIKKER